MENKAMKEQAGIIEGNIAIAEFMGAKWIEDDYGTMGYKSDLFPSYNKYWAKESLKYHTSWDWLMPVVKQIRTLWTKKQEQLAARLMEGCFQGNIEIVWLAVVEFINFWNQKQKQMKEQPAPENLAQDIYEALQAEVFPIGNYAIHIIQKVLDRHEVNTLPIAQQQSVPVSASEYFEKHKVVTVTHEVPFLSQEDFMQYAAQSAPEQSAGVWVRASQNKPDNWKLKPVRFSHTKEIICDIENQLEIRPQIISIIEWLDEGQQLQSQQQEDKVIEEVKEYMNDLDSYFQEDKIPDEAIEKLESDYAKSKIDWAEKLYNHLKHIYDSYADEWTAHQMSETSELLHDYQTRNIP